MKTKLLQQDPQQTYALVFDKEDDFMSELEAFATEKALAGSHFTGIGAFKEVTLGYFDGQMMDYKKIHVDEQVEVLSLVGNIARDDGGLKIHAHVVLGKRDGAAVGGHILEARVWPTLEIILEKSPRHLQRKSDQETGLALLDV